MLNIVSTIVLKTFRKSIDVILSFFPEKLSSAAENNESFITFERLKTTYNKTKRKNDTSYPSSASPQLLFSAPVRQNSPS